jgi:hypothetical protein
MADLVAFGLRARDPHRRLSFSPQARTKRPDIWAGVVGLATENVDGYAASISNACQCPLPPTMQVSAA